MRKPRLDSRFHRLTAGVLAILLHFAGFTAASAQSSATLAWNPNPESNVTGYRLHIGKRSGTFDEVRTLGKTTSTVVGGLEPETTYFFALQAVNDVGLLSALSSEISLTTPATPKPVIQLADDGGKPLSHGSASLDIGPVLIEGNGALRNLTVSNTGNAPLDGISFRISGVHAADFNYSSTGVTSLAPGASLSLSIGFRPSAAGWRNATLSIVSSDQERSPFDMSLAGTGTIPTTTPSPAISVSTPETGVLNHGSAQIRFGDAVIQQSTEIREFSITNSGTAPLTNLSIAVSGAHAADFQVSPVSSATLASGQTAVFELSFRPRSGGTRSATLRILSNDPSRSPFDISLAGTGVAVPEIAVERGDGSPLIDGSSSLAFGSANLGSSGSAIGIVVRNTGSGELSGLALNVAGSHPGDFTVSSIPGAISAGSSASFTVTFRPGVVGSRSAILRIASNDADENPFDISLTGTGVAVPEIAVERGDGSPLIDGSSSLAFGSANLGSSGSAIGIVVRNTGSGELSGLALNVAGSHPGDFTVSSIPGAISAGSSASFTVTFRPGAAGSRSAVLRIASNDADENPFDISLAGTGVAVPEIAVERGDGSPLIDGSSSLAFGSANLGSSGSAISIAVRNTGSGELSGLALNVAGSHPGDFTVSSIPGAISAGSSASFTVTFRPGAAGSRTAILRIASNDADENPFDISLAGTGVAVPEIAVAAPNGFDLKSGVSSVAFSSLDLAASGETKVFTIRNDGTAPLTGIKAAITGSHSADFTAFASAASLPAGASTVVSITFRPTSAGARTAMLHLSSNDADENPFVISLLGNGTTSPEIEVTRDDGSAPATDGESFGSMPVGESGWMKLRIHNRGTGRLDGISAVILGTHPQDFVLPATPVTTLDPGASSEVSIRFQPQAAGPRNAMLRISSNDADENPIDIPLRGTGSASPEIEISGIASVADGSAIINFGSTLAGINGATRSFVIKNTGNAPLTGLTIGLEGGRNSGFSINKSVAPRLAPGAVATVRVTFQPATKGPRTATLKIRSNDPDEREIRISLAGTGLPAPRVEIRTASSGTLKDGDSVVNFGNGNNPRMASRLFTLTNRGSAPLERIAVSLGGLHAPDFRLQKPVHRTLRPGQSTNFRVIFDPNRPGTRWAALRITSNDPSAESFGIVLTGRASPPSSTRKASSPRSKAAALPLVAKATPAPSPEPVASLMIIDGKRYRCISIPKSRGERIDAHRVEVSGNLVDWASGPDHVAVVTDNAAVLKVRDKTPIPPGGKRHIRLRQVR